MSNLPQEDLLALAGAALFAGIDETEPGPALARFLDDVGPGGIILFARNLGDGPQACRLTAASGNTGRLPRLVGVDEEGGRVQRLARVLGRLPAAAELARGGPERARAVGRLLARALRALGFNMDFAPVLDLSAPGDPNGIGDRSFGQEPEHVVSVGGAFLDGLTGGGLLGVVKHFPGLGPTNVDSHDALPRAADDELVFRARHLRPFQALLPRSPAVMVGHAHYPYLDASSTPASCSEAVVRRLLREELGYAGLVIADDLEMGAVEQGEGWLDAACSALAAGCDMVLVCRTRERVIALRDELVVRVQRGRFPEARLRESGDRIRAARRRAASLPSPPELEAARAALRELIAGPGPD